MKKLAIIVGHGSGNDKGCCYGDGKGETNSALIWGASIWERDVMFNFGQRLCENIFENITFRSERLNLLFLSKEGKETEKDIIKQVNRFNPDLAIELHANASTCNASGSEILISHLKYIMLGFDNTKWLSYFTTDIARKLNIRNRGIKLKVKGDRGYPFLSKTKCFSIITEPFFLDHESDYEEYLKNRDKLMMVFTQYILDFIYGG